MNRTDTFIQEVSDVLQNNILDFWIKKMTDPSGGFYGQITGAGEVVADAPKGAVLNARILWTFSAAYRFLHKTEYLETASKAKDYIMLHFIDHRYGGVYWSLDASGKALDTKKQFYALSFTIYGLSEYYKATGDEESLKFAINLYKTIEKESLETVYGGYIEATTRDWHELVDMRLSDKDANERKTMNTHLHILEAYSNLYSVWKDPGLKDAVIRLLDIFAEHIFDRYSGHLGLFFNDRWDSKDSGVSYGHDIEASWLLMEAAFAVGDIDVLNRIRPIALKIGTAALEGLQPDGSMIYEKHSDGSTDKDRHWWVQAETVVGSLWLWKYHSLVSGADYALKCWKYIQDNLIDYTDGEWYWSCHNDGSKNISDDKAGLWKCPYHNTRMCLQVLEIFSSTLPAENPCG